MEARYGGRRWELMPGGTLTFGRAEGNDVRIGTEPEDRLVSRLAGRVRTEPDGVRVHNDSGSQEIYVLPIPGRELSVGPGRSVGLRERYLRVVVLGGFGARYEIVLDLRGIGAAVAPPQQPVGGARTAGAPEWLTPAERRMLAALCEPLLNLAGQESRAATIEEVAARLGRSAGYVRRCLNDLRERLTTAEGLPRMRGDETGQAAGRFTDQLADWAVRTEVVTRDSLAALPAR